MYPSGFATSVAVEGPAMGLETDIRPHFLQALALSSPNYCFRHCPMWLFLARKITSSFWSFAALSATLIFRWRLCGPIIREADGLAMSSRNAYLSPANANCRTPQSGFARSGRSPDRPILPKQKRMMRCSKPGFPPSIMPAFATPRRWPARRTDHAPSGAHCSSLGRYSSD